MARRGYLIALASLALAAGIYAVLAARSRHAPVADRRGSGFIDSAVCAGCHPVIAASYRLTGMGRSFYRPRPGNAVEDYRTRNTLYHASSGRRYVMRERDGRLYQRRSQVGFDGKETNILETEISFVIGSGNHARSYLHRTAAGQLVELPVSWYAEKGGYWAMSPGYDRPDHDDFRRRIAYDCMFCHNGYPSPEQAAPSGEPVFGNAVPEGIDCQRCHGPGRWHVEAASSGGASPDSIRRAILNPARLDRDRQLEVCMQCHLETTSSPLPYVVRRLDHGPFDYRPGRPLGEYFIFFDHPPGAGREDKFEIAHAAYRLRKSACFQASRMTCITCHNPHQAPRGEAAVKHFAAVCRNCHASAHPAGPPAAGSCLDCHMPRRRAEDAVHVVMTDHYIQRRKPTRDLLAPLEEHRESAAAYRGEVALYYPPQLPSMPENELYLAVAQVRDGANLPSGIPRLRNAIEKHRPAAPQFYLELGKAYGKAGNAQEAIAWLEEALRRRADDRPVIKELAIVLTASGRLPRAAELLERAAAAPPPDAVVLADLGNVYLRQGKLEQAGPALRKAVSLDPDLPEVYNLLALLSSQTGDAAAAEKYFREAIRLHPDLAEAHYNLGNLLARRADYPQAAFHLEKAIAASPGYVEAHHGYGLILLLMRSYEKAQAELEQALRLDPNLAQVHTDLADLLAARGRPGRAASEYRAALALNPRSPEAAYGLGSVLAALRQPDEAEQQFRLAVQSNPEYHEAHLALAGILARKGRAAEASTHYRKAAESPDPAVRQAALNALR